MIERVDLLRPWEETMEPFKIVGNLYFVGMHATSSHLIDTGDGLILIDTGYLTGLYQVIDSIYRLGYNPRDIKYVVNTHWHWDHAEASQAVAELSGAKNLIGHYDAEDVKRYFEPDILIKDGDTLSLGNTTIHFMETPGHTKGTISFFFDASENGKSYRVGMFGGAGVNTLSRGNYEYDGCVEDYFNSVNRLKKEKVDVFIGNHVWNNDTVGKGEILRKTGENKFIDSIAWNEFLDSCEGNLKKVIAEETKNLQK